jgi:hypothetical protein
MLRPAAKKALSLGSSRASRLNDSAVRGPESQGSEDISSLSMANLAAVKLR